MNYLVVKPLKNKIGDDFIANNNLFAIFNKLTVNVLFLDNFICNIDSFKDIFVQNNMHENIFFSCKSNKSYALLKTAVEQDCGIEVSSFYELIDALKYTKKIIA